MEKYIPKNPDTWIPKELFAVYCGDKSEALLKYYDKARDKKNALTMRLNWFALLVLPAWFGYRRQWTLWGTFTGLFVLLPFVELGFGFEVPIGAFGGTGLAMGLMADGLLLSNANTVYRKLRNKGLDDAAVRAALADRAKPSPGSAFAGGLGALGLIAGAVFLAETLLG